jgi:hypothetical protein
LRLNTPNTHSYLELLFDRSALLFFFIGFFGLILEHVTWGQTVAVMTVFTAIRALPEPSVLASLDSFEEMLANLSSSKKNKKLETNEE